MNRFLERLCVTLLMLLLACSPTGEAPPEGAKVAKKKQALEAAKSTLCVRQTAANSVAVAQEGLKEAEEKVAAQNAHGDNTELLAAVSAKYFPPGNPCEVELFPGEFGQPVEAAE